MDNNLSIALIAGLGGMFGWGFADFFAKKTIDEVGDVASLAWAGLFGTIALAIYAAYSTLIVGHPLSIPTSIPTWILLAFFGILQALVYLFAYNGFGKGQVAVLTPVFASFAGLTSILSIVFFHEAVGAYRLLALAVVFAGIMLLSLDPQALRARHISFIRVPGLFEVVIATLLAAVWTILWDQFVNGRDWLSYAILMFAFMTIAVFVAAGLMQRSLKVHSRSLWKFLALIGLCEIVAYVSISLGYGMTPLTSVVAILSGAFSLPTIVLARLFLGERPGTLQTAGSFVIVFGILLLPLV